MQGRAINVIARVGFLLSGVASLAIALLYTMTHGSDLPRQSEWVIFAVVLWPAGGVNVLLAILPASWTARACRIEDKSSLFSLSLRMLGSFAVVSYVLTVGLFFTPREWNLGGFLWTYLLCPVYVVRATVDPTPMELFLILAPINAGVLGAIGTVLGLGFRRR